ncbi:lymphocyte antigen 75-like [Amphiprion ocellaris]|uniref:lymphocyte antigen 75-like n=1 Tax=Amphiprion ocellaris TaxID=80972 RepID=UPI0024114091|nr:lymphocyte antigen 75-like [Amphiprion ocellaris]
MTEMSQFFNTVSSTGYNSDVWIGLYAEIEWFWADGIDAEYRNWEDGEPNFSIGQYCVSTRRAAKWMHIKCEISCPFICNNGTLQDPEFVLVNETLSWNGARQHCQENFTDLATVWDDAENQQVQNMAASEGWTWIGLFSFPHYYWSDYSNSSFSNWGNVALDLGTMTNVCAFASLPESGKWKLSSCETKLPFVCYAPPLLSMNMQGEAKKQVVKLRIKLDDSSVDLNDPAVKAALLKKASLQSPSSDIPHILTMHHSGSSDHRPNVSCLPTNDTDFSVTGCFTIAAMCVSQLQDRLKEEGVSGVTLKWREQPDGEVWHKEDP